MRTNTAVGGAVEETWVGSGWGGVSDMNLLNLGKLIISLGDIHRRIKAFVQLSLVAMCGRY